MGWRTSRSGRRRLHHGEIGVGCVELHVNLFVDKCLAVLVEVLPDFGDGHRDDLVFGDLGWGRKDKETSKL